MNIESDRELFDLASAIARWAETVPCIKVVYLFGSRARGDHRPDSDVDLRIEFDYQSEDFESWLRENREDFAALKAVLPGRLALHQDWDDITVPIIAKAAVSPRLVVGNVCCVATPRPPGYAALEKKTPPGEGGV